MSNAIIKESCVESLSEALHAQNNGAHQIELCSRLDLDGSTPSLQLVNEILDSIAIPVKIIVNPYPYEYSYDQKILKWIFDMLKEYPIEKITGIVFGPLQEDGFPDLRALEYARSKLDKPITFHKSIDSTPDIFEALQMLIKEQSVDFILSSGGAPTAHAGRHVLKRMKSALRGTSTEIIAAGRITKFNLDALVNDLGSGYYHGRKIV